MTPRIALFTIAILGLPLGGCTQYGAWNSQGMWQPTGSNAANLRAMVADPQDLVAGRGSAAAPGDEAARAVADFEAGKLPSLASSSSSEGAGGDGGGGGTGGMSSGGGSSGAGMGGGP